MLDGCYDANDDISATLDIVYVEAQKISAVTLTIGGREYNPFAADDPDNLRLKILRGLTTDFNFTRTNGLNKIRVNLAPT